MRATVWFPFCIAMMLPPGAAGGGGPDLAADPAALRRTVADLTSIDPPRNYRHPASLDRAADRIRDALLALRLPAEDRPFRVDGRTYRNVVASVRPDLPARIVVGAHYDVCGDQPGADDNASAVAGLLEAARLVASRRERLAFRVDFAAYCLEEPPFFGTRHMGSRHHAAALRGEGAEVRAMICLEMIGYFTDVPGSQRFPAGFMRLFYPDTGNFIAVVGNPRSRRLVREVKASIGEAQIPVESLAAPAWVPGVGLSDHSSFWKHGYPAVMVTDTAFYRNPHYHRVTDTIDTLDFERMAQVVRGVAWAVLQLR